MRFWIGPLVYEIDLSPRLTNHIF